MKSGDVQRAVRTNRHDRAAGDAPSIGRVTKMPGTGLPKGGLRKKRRSDGGQGNRVREGRKSVIMIWSLLLVGVVVLLLGLAVWLWVIPQMKRQPAFAGKIPGGVELESRMKSKFPSPTEEDALALVKRALAIRDPAQVADFFRPGVASPQEVVDFLQALHGKDGEADRFDWLSSMDANRLVIDGVVVGFKSAGKPRNRLALLTPDTAGKWRIDFDAFARTVAPSWSDLLEKRVPSATVRVYVAKDSYYNGPFSDDRQWVCYGIASPDTEQVLIGYCKAGSPQAAALKWMFSKGPELIRVTLEIRRVDGAESRQFEISQVLAEDWVVGPAAFDQGFD